MKLRELVEKIDNDIVLWIVRAPDTNILFKRENASDVIPENLLCMEVGTFFPFSNGASRKSRHSNTATNVDSTGVGCTKSAHAFLVGSSRCKALEI